jgi:hypothetical protein
MKIIVVGDFHIPERADKIPEEIIKFSKNCDYIICTGDYTSEEVLEELEKANKNIIAIRGNCDFLNLPEYKEIEIKNKKIGVIHSHQFGRGNIPLIRDFAKTQNLDLLIFGHTHKPFLEEKEVKLLNPGTATGVFSGVVEKQEKTFAILEINNEISIKIRKLL